MKSEVLVLNNESGNDISDDVSKKKVLFLSMMTSKRTMVMSNFLKMEL